ncbi:MAG: hypothetical protein LVQ97_00725 [Candidatus Micrarchaeales archaeon]|jgi:hypothetical protein|uniref:Uncharacterized protein n=1 Tax=Candidatus Micrarchaeum acidiphilum ARMAN-2 TaxID=425595 RepID=C7DHM2_MICA2|nr:MAG: hypothetical protein UNLARM2_0565 [Candidatus Micrarchaeum acidiphilum ARMAN-2]MCW6160695.1 hypothetical protein [Candidatus Micrarchaeales archaeon]
MPTATKDIVFEVSKGNFDAFNICSMLSTAYGEAPIRILLRSGVVGNYVKELFDLVSKSNSDISSMNDTINYLGIFKKAQIDKLKELATSDGKLHLKSLMVLAYYSSLKEQDRMLTRDNAIDETVAEFKEAKCFGDKIAEDFFNMYGADQKFNVPEVAKTKLIFELFKETVEKQELEKVQKEKENDNYFA